MKTEWIVTRLSSISKFDNYRDAANLYDSLVAQRVPAALSLTMLLDETVPGVTG